MQSEHNARAVCCRANPEGRVNGECPHPPVCVNCAGSHSALEHACPFWRHRFDATWYRLHGSGAAAATTAPTPATTASSGATAGSSSELIQAGAEERDAMEA
ncbi:hypothetical protein OBBRIDRAFT_765063, partial [Obba rivulosa]